MRSDVEQILQGKVARISREVDRETRELLVDVSFDELPKKLVFGQRVDLRIELARGTDVVRVPARVVIQRDGEEGAFVANSGRAEFRALEIGMRGRELIEVTGGLSTDDVVLDPSLEKNKLLKDGQRVRLMAYQDEERSR